MSKQVSNSELFAHENDALTARPQLNKGNMYGSPNLSMKKVSNFEDNIEQKDF